MPHAHESCQPMEGRSVAGDSYSDWRLSRPTGRLSDPIALPRGEAGASPCQACPVRHLTVCGALAPEELAPLSQILLPLELAPGDPLFNEGDAADNAYNVTSGTVKIYRLLPDGRCQITGFLTAGDFLGLGDDETYAFSAEAVSNATLCRFPRQKLRRLLDDFPQMEKRLLQMAGRELAAAKEQMVLLGRKTAKERIISFLINLSRAAARRGESDNPVALPMTRADMGDYLGLTTETVSRTITQLKKERMIDTQTGSRIALLDRPALETMAEGY